MYQSVTGLVKTKRTRKSERMTRSPPMKPTSIKFDAATRRKAQKAARKRGLSFNAFVRTVVAQASDAILAA